MEAHGSSLAPFGPGPTPAVIAALTCSAIHACSAGLSCTPAPALAIIAALTCSAIHARSAGSSRTPAPALP
uniref:Uncharacterized protein n=1 Tax=Romanomermis culicivorax TaxID=13658 RepID=A0A915JYG9_ROMCU